MESKLRIRKTQSLRRGRVSVPNARYFVTICVEDRKPVLCSEKNWKAIRDQLESQQREGDLKLHCAVLMPDHLHLVFRLGERLKLGHVIGKFKAKLDIEVLWQKDFYDHMLQADDSEESYGLYLFMNPYRASLVELDAEWEFWKRWREAPFDFEEFLREGEVIPTQWISESEKVKAGIIKRDAW
ncbi:REP-associated tyrosine transposase [Pelagicoccus enzymogenes]|nr:transposase [Pelagicoccus enzymogenes]